MSESGNEYQEPMAKPKKDVANPRRRFLTKVAKTTAAVAVAVGVYTGLKEISPANPDNAFKPNEVYQGQVEIKIGGANVRKEPVIINNPNDEPNIVPWENIKEVNGVNIEGKTSFIVGNPLITEGDNPNPAVGEKSPWITLQTNEGTVFINKSKATLGAVNPIGEGKIVQLSENSTASTNAAGAVSFTTTP
jgi:hypothetical protein